MDRNARDQEELSAPTSTESRKTFLNGWKEIAAYVGRGVRTVQRWEALGLPVRRPNSRLRSAVMTTTEEVDTWLNGCGDGRLQLRPATAGAFAEHYESLAQEIRALREQLEQLRAENKTLRRQLDAIQSPQDLSTPLQAASSDAA